VGKPLFLRATLIYTLLIVIISLVPIPNLSLPEFKLLELDKLIHLSIYFIMSIMWMRLQSFSDKFFPWKNLLIVFFIASSTEFLQGALPVGRYSDWADFIANSAGILLGITTYSLFFSKIKQS
jgi:VanZ family protein|tara:strand:- start:454 stop:822 length:369 start_codon:yes stop_codon:yes gene_type:complete